jgi:hypothetical protein
MLLELLLFVVVVVVAVDASLIERCAWRQGARSEGAIS